METGDSGITLLELVVACALTLIIGVSVAGALYSGNSAWRSGEALMETHRNAAGALDVMAREISAMYIAPPNQLFRDTGLFYGETEGMKEFRFYALITGQSGKWDLCRVGYRYNEKNREIQRLFNVDLQEEKEMVWQPLVSGIESLEFFLYPEAGGEPVSSWDTLSEAPGQSGRLPEAVGIAVSTRDAMGLFEEREFKIRVCVPVRDKRVFIP